jgi:hypothetical protein
VNCQCLQRCYQVAQQLPAALRSCALPHPSADCQHLTSHCCCCCCCCSVHCKSC